jgi:hypothetical protein
MAQIWMTYDELAGLSDCTPAEARMRAIHCHLTAAKAAMAQPALSSIWR